jgi:hypothetical protein
VTRASNTPLLDATQPGDDRSTNPPPPDKSQLTSVTLLTPAPTNDKGAFTPVQRGRRTCKPGNAIPQDVVTTPIHMGNQFGPLESDDTPSIGSDDIHVATGDKTPAGSHPPASTASPVQQLEHTVCQGISAINKEIAAIHAIPSTIPASMPPDALARLQAEMTDTRDLVASLYHDLRKGLIKTATAFNDLLHTVTANNAKLSKETQRLSSRILEHQTHLDHLMKFKETQCQQMDNHWRAMEDLKSVVEATTTDSKTQTLRLLAQLDGICATTDHAMTTARTDINNIRAHQIPDLRKKTDNILNTVSILTNRVEHFATYGNTATPTPTRKEGMQLDTTDPSNLPATSTDDHGNDPKALRRTHRSDNTWYHGVNPCHNVCMGPTDRTPFVDRPTPPAQTATFTCPNQVDTTTDPNLGGIITMPCSTDKDRAAR